MSRFLLSNVAFSPITSKLDKDLEDDQKRSTTHRRNKKRDMVRRLIVVRPCLYTVNKMNHYYEFLIAQREFYGEYHHQKEQMAYAATALFLTGAAWLMYDSTAQVSGLMVALALVIGVAAFAFVAWQLRQRRFAADMVEACERLLACTLSNNQSPAPLTDTRLYNGLLIPHFLVDEMVAIADARKPFRGALLSELITYLTMLASAGIVVARLLY